MTAISRSVPYCWPSSMTMRDNSCMKPPSVDHCMVRSWATVPPVAKPAGTCLAFVFFLSGGCRIWCGSNCFCYVLGPRLTCLCAQTPPTGVSSHRSRSAKDRVPEFSLQINKILRLSVVSISIRARMRTAIDLTCLHQRVLECIGLVDW